jgi:hypothetical protein
MREFGLVTCDTSVMQPPPMLQLLLLLLPLLLQEKAHDCILYRCERAMEPLT